MASSSGRPSGPDSTVPTLTCTEAREGQRELPEEVVAGGVIVVLYHEAHQSQVGDMDGEVKGAVPPRVEAWSKDRTRDTCMKS